MSPIASILPLALIAAALLAGCGSGDSNETTAPAQSGSETTQAQESATGPIGAAAKSCGNSDGYQLLAVIGVNCGTGSKVAAVWAASSKCQIPEGQSRTSCTVSSYRCLATAAERGASVSCSRPQRAIAFISRP